MALNMGALPYPEPPSLASENDSQWAEPATEAAQCLASMSSSTTGPTAPSAATSNPATQGERDASAESDIDLAAGAREAPRSKPARLSLACNPCRKRKVRCDARQPKCHNCTVRREVCITSDPRHPGAPVATRKRATRRRTGSTRALHSLPDAEQSLVNEQLVEKSDHPLPPSPVSVAVVLPLEPRRPSLNHTRSASHVEVPLPRSDNPPDTHYESSTQGPIGVGVIADPGTVRTHASNASSTKRGSTTNQSQSRDRPESITWLSRAYQEISVEQGRKGTDLEQQDPAAVTPDVVVNTDGSPHRSKVLGGSSLQCLFNFADLWLGGYGFDATTPLFRHGLSRSEELYMPLQLSLPDLPHGSVLSRCIDAYAERIWPLFPIIARDVVQSDVDAFLKLQNDTPGSLQSKVHPSRVPNLAVVYAILCVGSNEMQLSEPECGISSDMRASYLTACYSLQGHLTAAPYQTSVQALLLLTLSLRGYGKDGQSWYILGQATRLALSLGLHKMTRRSTNHAGLSAQQRYQLSETESFRRRLWGSCYSLEMLLQLESGRPSSIGPAHIYRSSFDDRGTPTPGDEGVDIGDEEEKTFFTAWVSLASIMGQISCRLYSLRNFNGALGMLGETARLSKCLTAWEAALPENLKPHAESGNDHVLAIFLAQQFYHAQIAVSRTAIVFPHKGFQAQVQACSLQDPEIKRLLGSAALCVSASRSLIMQTLQLADAGVHSVLIGIPQTFLASVVLALSILRAPGSRLARFDVELLTSATGHVESCYQAWGYPPAFLSILSRLRERAGAVSRGEVTLRTIQSRNEDNNNDTQGTPGASNGVGGVVTSRNGLQTPFQPQMAVSSNQGDPPQFMVAPGMGNMASSAEVGMDAFGLDFEDLWNMLDTDMFMYDMGGQWDGAS